MGKKGGKHGMVRGPANHATKRAVKVKPRPAEVPSDRLELPECVQLECRVSLARAGVWYKKAIDYFNDDVYFGLAYCVKCLGVELERVECDVAASASSERLVVLRKRSALASVSKMYYDSQQLLEVTRFRRGIKDDVDGSA